MRYAVKKIIKGAFYITIVSAEVTCKSVPQANLLKFLSL